MAVVPNNYGDAIGYGLSAIDGWKQILNQDKVWVTKEQRPVSIRTMAVDHVANTIAMLERHLTTNESLVEAVVSFADNTMLTPGGAKDVLHQTPLMNALVERLLDIKWNESQKEESNTKDGLQ